MTDIPASCPHCASWLVPRDTGDPAVFMRTCAGCSYAVVTDAATGEPLVEKVDDITIEHVGGVVRFGGGRALRRRFGSVVKIRRFLPWM